MKSVLRLFGFAACFSIAAPAAADKDRFDVGEEVGVFTLKAVNPDESGESYVTIDKYYGAEAKEPRKAVLLSFFATYCEPCKREMPFLAALYDTYQEKGLQVLLVSIDKEADKIEIAKSLANEAKVRFPVLTDRFNIVAKRYFIQKLPCVYIIDAQGRVAMVNVGYSGDVTKTLLDEVRKQIGEPAGDPVPGALAEYMAHGNGSAPAADGGEPPAADDGEAKPADGDATAAAGEESAEAVAAAEEPPAKGKKKKRKKRKRKRKKKK